MDQKEMLLRAAELLESGELSWEQGTFFRYDGGTPCGACAVGACIIARYGTTDALSEILATEAALDDAGVDPWALEEWNDHHAGSVEEVVAELRRLAETL